LKAAGKITDASLTEEAGEGEKDTDVIDEEEKDDGEDGEGEDGKKQGPKKKNRRGKKGKSTVKQPRVFKKNTGAATGPKPAREPAHLRQGIEGRVSKILPSQKGILKKHKMPFKK
jgi:hypothetical protein